MPVELENSALKVSSTAPPVKAAPASAPVVSVNVFPVSGTGVEATVNVVLPDPATAA
jgi:hypothetical protein